MSYTYKRQINEWHQRHLSHWSYSWDYTWYTTSIPWSSTCWVFSYLPSREEDHLWNYHHSYQGKKGHSEEGKNSNRWRREYHHQVEDPFEKEGELEKSFKAAQWQILNETKNSMKATMLSSTSSITMLKSWPRLMRITISWKIKRDDRGNPWELWILSSPKGKGNINCWQHRRLKEKKMLNKKELNLKIPQFYSLTIVGT